MPFAIAFLALSSLDIFHLKCRNSIEGMAYTLTFAFFETGGGRQASAFPAMGVKRRSFFKKADAVYELW